jgi:hypothetical protein
MDEVIRQFRSDSPRDRALTILDGIPSKCPPARRRHLIQKALKTDPECIEALAAFAATEPAGDRRAAAYERAVELGRAQCAELIASLEPGDGLWGFARARPFLAAMHDLAFARTYQRRPGEAIGLLREILTLNPGDNQGVRYDLLTLLLGHDRLEDAFSLLEEYPEDDSAYWLYTGALAHFMAALGETGFEVPPEDQMVEGSLGDVFRDLPAEFTPVNRMLDQAIAANPFVSRFVIAGSEVIDRLEWPPHYACGSPDEAFLYAARTIQLWEADLCRSLWLLWRTEIVSRRRVWKASLDRHAESLADYEAQLTLAGDPFGRRG